MRRLLVGTLFAVAACGGGGGSGSNAVSGTIGGRAFTPAESVAVVAGPADCTQPVPITVKAFAIRFADFTGVCTDLEADPLCRLRASSRIVSVVFADVKGLADATLGPGTFDVNPNPAVLAPQTSGPLAGTAVATFAVGITTGASCPVGTEATVAKGTLTVGSVSPTAISGSIDLTFGTLSGGTFNPGPDTLKGDFTATVCGGTVPDVCSLAAAGGQCASPICGT